MPKVQIGKRVYMGGKLYPANTPFEASEADAERIIRLGGWLIEEVAEVTEEEQEPNYDLSQYTIAEMKKIADFIDFKVFDGWRKDEIIENLSKALEAYEEVDLNAILAANEEQEEEIDEIVEQVEAFNDDEERQLV